MSKKYLRLLLLVAIMSILLALMAILYEAEAAPFICTNNAQCSIFNRNQAYDSDGGDNPGIPGSCTPGGTYICQPGFYSICYNQYGNDGTPWYDSCSSLYYLYEYIQNPSSPQECKSLNAIDCDEWCQNYYQAVQTGGWCTGTTGTPAYCQCKDTYGNVLVPGTPSVKNEEPISNVILKECESLPIKVSTKDEGGLEHITVIIATPIPGVHCDYWPRKRIKFDMVHDVYTFDCIRDAGILDCFNIPEKDWDLSLRFIDDPNDPNDSTPVCPVTGLISPCAVMSTIEDNLGNSFSTEWTYFYLTTCGDGICDPYETPSNCEPDCRYSFMEQLKKMKFFAMEKIKVIISR